MKYAILTIFLFVRTLFQWLHHPRPYRSMQAFEIMAILIDVSTWLPTMMNVVQMNNSLRDNIVWHNLNYHYHHWSETWHIWIKFFILTILKLLVRYVLITFDQYNSFSTFFLSPKHKQNKFAEFMSLNAPFLYSNPLSMGLCVPSTCLPYEIEDVINFCKY